MNKKLSVRAVLAVAISMILFCMPIGALIMNQSMVVNVRAEEENTPETGGIEVENPLANEGNEEPGEGNGEPTDPGEGGEDPSNPGEGEEEPPKPVCTCKNQCTSNYNYDSRCEACSADYKNCTYVNPNVNILISGPDGWVKDSAKVKIGVSDIGKTGNFEIAKVEAKIGQSGSWQDITEDMYIEISENCSVYVQVTDQEGRIYSKNRNIKCFDNIRPTLNAAVSNGLLTVVGYDSDSGIKAIYVNGYEFKELTNGTLNIRLQQFDTGYEYFSIQAMDHAGNMSEVYRTKNPYYDDDKTDDDDKGASTLPADATPTKPSSATATVTEHTKTDGERKTTYSSTAEAQKHASMAEADAAERAELGNDEKKAGKEFYTIQTANEKVFYLIIDNDGEQELVYFLTEITENDLLNVTTDNKETLPKNSAAVESAIPTEDALPNNNGESEVVEEEPATEEIEEPVEEVPEPEEDKPVKESNSFGVYIVLIIMGAGAIGLWYYLKVVKKKKEDFVDEEDEEDDEIYEEDVPSEYEDDFFSMDEEDVTETIDE